MDDNVAQSEQGAIRKLWGAFSQRLGLKNFTYAVPEHAQSLPYMLGGLALAGFTLLIVTGILLAQFYNPNQLNSNESVAYLISNIPFGNFIRSVHYWTATIVFVLVVLHLIRAFITGSYKKPREFTWLSGLGLLGVTIGFIFTGSMLSLGQEGIEALEHNGEVGMLMGTIGIWFSSGFSASVPLIGRVYVAHMTILGALFAIFIAAHMYLIKTHGISPKATKDALAESTHGMGKGHFDQHIMKLTGWALILVAVVSLLALLWPEALISNGVAGVEATKPPWMFLWIFGMEDLFGIKALLWGPGVVFLLLGIIPFIDRSPYLSPRRRLWVMAYGAAILLALIALTIQASRISIEPKKADTKMGGFLPVTIRKVENFLIPQAYAHGMPSLSFTPTVVTHGEKVTFSGDGLQTDGDYEIYLKSPRKTILLGVTSVEKGEDMFDVDLKIPSSLPGDMYSVEMHSLKNTQFTFFAPLQLAVQPVAVPTPQDMPFANTYPIPQNEVPWIISFIILSTGFGALLILKK